MLEGIDVTSGALAERLGVRPGDMKRLREEHLVEGMDWYKDGARVMIRPSGQLKLEVTAETLDDAPLVAPRYVDAVVIEPWANRRWVKCRLAGGVAVSAVFGRWGERVKRGQKVRLQVVRNSDGAEAYRYYKLGP